MSEEIRYFASKPTHIFSERETDIEYCICGHTNHQHTSNVCSFCMCPKFIKEENPEVVE